MRKKCLLLTGVIFCLAAAGFCLFFGLNSLLNEPATADFAPVRPSGAGEWPVNSATENADNGGSKSECPVDFSSLKKINSDIYAWIDLPGTDISYPVLQSESDDSFYLDHDSDGNYNANGAVFSERQYNTKTFDDPVTVLYGHDMMSGKMFGQLQSDYSDAGFFEENNEIIIYTPERGLHYRIFAATPYYRIHLLHYYPFEKSYVFNQFFDELYNYRTLSSFYSAEYKPYSGDKVVVLSTCMNTGDSKRFLVMGVLKFTEEYSAD